MEKMVMIMKKVRKMRMIKMMSWREKREGEGRRWDGRREGRDGDERRGRRKGEGGGERGSQGLSQF